MANEPGYGHRYPLLVAALMLVIGVGIVLVYLIARE